MNPTHWNKSFFRKLSASCALIFLGTACSSSDDTIAETKPRFQKGEYINRRHDDALTAIPPAQPHAPAPYPWEEDQAGNQLKITKEFFRCRGSSLNPVHAVQQKGELVRYFDCGGAEKHSLPLRGDKEFIYPILIDLLNYIQAKTQKRVVITSGHRCPDHNIYVDPTEGNRYSKHMIGGEVSFYVQGLEDRPDASIRLIQDYYKETPKYGAKKEFLEFQKYEKPDCGVATPPLYNKEIFIKLYKSKEGRNFDNRHPYPYVSLQVRYDFDLQEKVVYSWEKATHNYMRY